VNTTAPYADAPLAAEREGDWEQALLLWRQARLLAPHDSSIVQATARCLRRLGRHPEAAVLLEQQLRLQPEALPLQLATLEGLAEAGRWQTLLAAMAPLLAALPDDPDLADLLRQATARLLPDQALPDDASAAERHSVLRPWLPQQLLLVCGLPDWTGACRRLPPPTEPTPTALVALLPDVRPGEPTVLAPADLAALLPVWHTLIQQRGLDATVVLLSLHPVLALPRLQQQHGIGVDDALDLWCSHQLLAERHSRSLPRRRLAAAADRAEAEAVTAADPTRLERALALHQALLHPDEAHCQREADRLGAGGPAASAAEVAQRLSLEAQAATDAGDLALAVPLYRQAMAQMPDHRGLYPALARCLRLLDRAAEAEALLSRHLSEQPGSAPGWIGLAEGERQRGHWQAALAHYDRALQLDPGHRGLPRAIAHTAERLLPPGDAALALPTPELLQQLLPQLPQRLLLVLGMHRSGTSAMAGLLASTGLLCPAGSPPADPFNPRGYWEPLQLLACHNALLDEAGGRWDDPHLAPLAPTPARLQQLARALQADFPTGGPQGVALIKDPRQCRLQPLWNALLAQRGLEAAVVLMHRHPLAVAASLARRDGLPLSRGLLLWLQHQLEAERHSRHLPRVRLDFQQLLQDPPAALQACRALLPGLAPLSPEVIAAAGAHIDPSLDHGRAADATTADPELLRLALGVHGALADPDEGRCRAACDQASARLAGHLRQLDDQLGLLDTAQLFWRTGDDDFHEAASCRRSVTVARGRQVQQTLPLPSGVGPLRALRLDPSEQPGVLRILWLELIGGEGQVLWRWTAGADGRLPAQPATPGTRLLPLPEGGSLVLADDADPGLLLEVPQATLEALGGGGSLVFEARWDPLGPDLGRLLAALPPP